MVSRSSVGQHNSREANALRNQRHQRSSWFLRRLLLDGHNCQRQYILVFQQPSSFFWESFAGVEETNSFLFLSLEWHRTCRKGFTDVLKLRRSNIHFYPFMRQHHCSKKKRFCGCKTGFIAAGIIIAAELFILLPVIYVTTSGRRGNRYLRIGGMLSIPQYLDCSRTRI